MREFIVSSIDGVELLTWEGKVILGRCKGPLIKTWLK